MRADQIGLTNVGVANNNIVGETNKLVRLGCMTRADSPAPARLTDKPTWLISQISTHAHRLLAANSPSRGRVATTPPAGRAGGVRPASQGSLGRRTGIDRSDVVAALNGFGGRGLVERTPDPADHRRNVITITPAGHGAPGAARRRCWPSVQDELLAPLSPANAAS